MNLLLRKQTHRSVATAIMELVERLLTLQDHQEEVTEDTDVTPDIPVQQKLPVDSEAVLRLSCKSLLYTNVHIQLNMMTQIRNTIQNCNMFCNRHFTVGSFEFQTWPRTMLFWLIFLRLISRKTPG